MGNYDFVEELSDSDDDDSLRDEIAAVSAACLPSTSGNLAGNFNFDDDDDDDDDDDLELVRSLKEKYGGDISNPLSLKPIATLPPVDSDDEEDDFETLRAIERRFSQYDDGDGEARSDGDGEADATESKSEICTEKLLPDDASCMNLENESFDVCRNDREQGPCSTSESGDISNSTSNFPKSAQAFIEAIKKNRSCQKFLRSKMLHIEARMEEINALKKKIGTLKEYHVACKKKIGRALSQKQDARIQLISAPRLRANAKAAEKNTSPMLYGPVENSHVASYRASLVSFPQSFQRERWDGSKKEESDSKKLEKGIRQQVQKLLVEKSMSELDEPGYTHGLDEVMLSVRNFDITPKTMQDFAGKINWDELASIYLPHRSGVECEARWFNHENPLINRDGWTPAEDKQLLLLIQHYGLNNWSIIAEKLKTNRTPFQCLARYQRSLNASILKREWTEDEDAQLRSAVESFGESNWQVVASTLEGRTGTQCSNRWNKTLHPTRQRVGKWSDDEDKRLKVAVTLFGHKNWYRIAEFVPGRTQAQCRERWVNVLDPSLKRGPWTEEEDEKLRAAILEHGYCWSRIASCVPSRTDNHCRRRWKRLFPHEVPLLQAAKRIQKVALISNFVDRESERPALGPSDFAPLSIEGPVNEPTNEPTNDNLPKGQKPRKSRKSDSGRKLALCRTSKKAQSRKHKKRVESPENEMVDDDSQPRKHKKRVESPENEMVDDKARSRKRRKRVKSCEIEMVDGKAQSRKRRKRAKSPEIEKPGDNCVAQSSNGGRILLTYQRRKFRKPVSKEIIPAGSINIAAEPTVKPTNTSKELQSTECRKRARSPATDMSSDMTDAGQSDADDIMNKNRREARKSGSKKRKYSISTEIGRDFSKKSRESKNSDDTADMTWDLPIKIRSRRARGVSSKKIVTASNPSSEENYDPAMQNDEPMCSNSPQSGMGDDLEAQIPCMDHGTREQYDFIQKPENRTSNEIDQEDGSSVGDSVTSANEAENHFNGDSKSSKRKFAKRRHKPNKSQSEESEKWEDLPLAALLKKSAGCKKRRLSKDTTSSSSPPVCVLK